MLIDAATHMCPRKATACGNEPALWCAECPFARPDPLRQLIADLRREANEAEVRSVTRGFNYGYLAERAAALRSAADRLAAVIESCPSGG